MEISQYLNQKIIRPYILIGSIIFFIFSLVFSSLHYLNIFYGNGLSWISWIISILTFSYSFLPPKLSFYKFFKRIPKSDYLLASFITLLYWISHLWNFTIAPWNQNGLFDDAAWDIFFAKNHAFNGPFQAAFFDNVGYISREVVFHYYISTFFKLFGYNLLVFNISLLVLGFITVFFTAFIIQRFFKNTIITLISVVILNFFPFHYLHIFMGHRYTIAAPLMVISLYFLYQAFAHKSFFRASISALFAALCWDSAIMGKQYIFGLILAAIFILVLGRRKWKSKENIAISIVWIIGFIISAAPLLVYIFFNYDNYVFRENNLFGNFLLGYGQNGVLGVRQNLDQLIELFFAEDTFKRQFLHDFLLIPIAYYFFLIPGFLIALFKKRFEIVFLAVIPVLGAFISGSYDFRVLLAVPIWIICIGFYLNFLFKTRFIFGKNIQYAFIAISLFFVLLGLIPSVKYLWDVSKDPHHVYLLPHKDVAVSRLVQDIVVGSKNPTSKMKKDELNRINNLSTVSYDTFVCPFSSYAIMHLYLQNYDDKRILSFCNQGIQLLKDRNEIINDNVKAIKSYKPRNKDLKLVWEKSDKTIDVISNFSKYRKYGSDESITDSVDNESFSLYILTVKSENITNFQNDVMKKYTGNLL